MKTTKYDLDDLDRQWDNTDGEEIFDQQDTPELDAYLKMLKRIDEKDASDGDVRLESDRTGG